MDRTPQLSLPARILGLAIALFLTAIGAGFGFAQGLGVQVIILSAIATLALFGRLFESPVPRRVI